MLPADLLLSLRYLRPKRNFLSFVTMLSILGPAIGVAVLLVVMSVMNGFHQEIRRGIMDVQAHVNIRSRYEDTIHDPSVICRFLEENQVHASPVIEGTALIQCRREILPKQIRGILPEKEKDSLVARSLREGRFDIREGEVIIGDYMAAVCQLKVGDSFLLHAPSRLTKNIVWKEDGSVDIQQPKEIYQPEKVTVAGIYSVGIVDFDENIIFLSLDQAADLFGYEWGSATSVQGKVETPMEMTDLMNRLRQRFPLLSSISWQEANSVLFRTIDSEKSLMTFLLMFIILIAAFSIAAILLTTVVKKTREIGIMKAIGFSRFLIARIFIFQGMIIGVLGTTLGTILGLLILRYRQAIANGIQFCTGRDIFPAELYHLRQIPALTHPGDLVFTILLSLTICILASAIPALFAASLHPAQSLHEEA